MARGMLYWYIPFIIIGDPNGNIMVALLQRRAAERAGKSKKIGVHYYETANVKNRNLRKKDWSIVYNFIDKDVTNEDN